MSHRSVLEEKCSEAARVLTLAIPVPFGVMQNGFYAYNQFYCFLFRVSDCPVFSSHEPLGSQGELIVYPSLDF